jgi:hypothetical protein
MPDKNTVIYIVVACALLVAVAVWMYSRPKSENFDVNVDPVRTGYKQNIYTCPTPLEAQGNGLNVQGGGGDFTVCDFMEKFKDKNLPFPENDPLDVVPRQYCALMYENFQEDFHNRWESLGLCEQDVKEQLGKCPNLSA